MSEFDKLDLQSPDLVQSNLDKLAALFPNCVTEGPEGKVVDFDLLKQELSHQVVDGAKERYRLEWPGKREAIVTANLPTTKTLRPVREDSVDFDNTENLYIEGDNLEVLKLLQESYLGKIKMIYIDPPYNTGKDFVYKDNFSKGAQEELLKSGQKDEYNQRLVANPETAGRYHSDWLSMMYPRLKLARNLLTNDGVVFVSIDDNEVDNLRKVCDEIFGDSNFVASLIWRGGKRNAAKFISTSHEYLLFYARDLNTINKTGVSWKIKKKGIEEIYKKHNQLVREFRSDWASITEALKTWFKQLPEDSDAKKHSHFSHVDKRGIYFPDNISRGGGGGPKWQITNPITGNIVKTPSRGWAYSKKEDLLKDIEEEYVHFNGDGVPCKKSYLKEKETELLDTVFYKDRRGSSKRLRSLMGGNIFDFPKDELIIEELIDAVASNNDIVLDFFSGSATTAHAVLNLNSKVAKQLKFIQVQLDEHTDKDSEAYKVGYSSICEIGKERIRRAAKKIKEDISADIDYGFRVYRLDSSNMQDVYYRPQDYEQANLDLFADNVKPDRSPDDLLAQVMLDWGLPLSLKIEQVDVEGKLLFKVAGNSLYACFDQGVDESFAKAVAAEKPLRIVFRDKGFKDDTAKTNVKQLLKQLSPETEMKVI